MLFGCHVCVRGAVRTGGVWRFVVRKVREGRFCYGTWRSRSGPQGPEGGCFRQLHRSDGVRKWRGLGAVGCFLALIAERAAGEGGASGSLCTHAEGSEALVGTACVPAAGYL